MPAESTCVVLVPSARVVDPGFEEALGELRRRGYTVWRATQDDPPPGTRDRMASDALARGFDDLLWADPAVVFRPDDADRLRAHSVPVACAVAPVVGRRAVACEFLTGTTAVKFGTAGGLVEVLACGLGFALTRRAAFDAVRAASPGRPVRYFAANGGRDAEDRAFSERVRAAGLSVHADTSIRVWRVAPRHHGWEDAGADTPRYDDYTFRLAPPAPPSPLRESARPFPPVFPRLKMFVVTYPANADSLAATLASVRASDWGEEPVVVTQPADVSPGREAGARTYKRALEAAADDGCDFALVLEDDVRVNRHLRHNLTTLPLVAEDRCDHLGLFIPDLIADPWERAEPHLGYRLAKPRFEGANAGWERNRVWGAQAYLLSARLVRAALSRWDELPAGQDTRVLAVCAAHGVPLWYTLPCLAEHAPVRSAFGTPTAFAPDFDPDFRLTAGDAFRPPDGVPDAPTHAEAELLWRLAAGKDVLELGAGRGGATVCVGQSARGVVSVVADKHADEATEWARRFGVAGRVTFVGAHEIGSGRFGLAVIAAREEVELTAAIRNAVPRLDPEGTIAFRGYPDPLAPSIRPVVDDHARRLGWRRVAQADFLGVFRVPQAADSEQK